MSVLRTHRHPSVSPMDSAEGLLGLELVALGEMKETSTSRDFNFLEDSKGDDNDGTSKYNALFCQQNALTGDLTVQRLYIGRASTQLCVTDSDERVSIRHRERLRKSVHTNPLKSVAESNTGLSIPAHIE